MEITPKFLSVNTCICITSLSISLKASGGDWENSARPCWVQYKWYCKQHCTDSGRYSSYFWKTLHISPSQWVMTYLLLGLWRKMTMLLWHCNVLYITQLHHSIPHIHVPPSPVLPGPWVGTLTSPAHPPRDWNLANIWLGCLILCCWQRWNCHPSSESPQTLSWWYGGQPAIKWSPSII